jgi:hypothetical protein
VVHVWALTPPDTPMNTNPPWTKPLRVYAVLGTSVRDCAHCAVSPPAAPCKAKVPLWAWPVTTLSEASQVQPDRLPVSKPGLVSALVAADARGITARIAASTVNPAARPAATSRARVRISGPPTAPLGKFLKGYRLIVFGQ